MIEIDLLNMDTSISEFFSAASSIRDRLDYYPKRLSFVQKLLENDSLGIKDIPASDITYYKFLNKTIEGLVELYDDILLFRKKYIRFEEVREFSEDMKTSIDKIIEGLPDTYREHICCLDKTFSN